MVNVAVDNACHEKIAVVIALMDHQLKTLTASDTGVAKVLWTQLLLEEGIS